MHIITVILALVFTVCPQPAPANSDGGSSGGGSTPPQSYKKVEYNDLDTYLKYAEAEMNYIEVTGTIPEIKFLGREGSPSEASELGKILKKYPTKKIALKIENYLADLTDISYCIEPDALNEMRVPGNTYEEKRQSSKHTHSHPKVNQFIFAPRGKN